MTWAWTNRRVPFWNQAAGIPSIKTVGRTVSCYHWGSATPIRQSPCNVCVWQLFPIKTLATTPVPAQTLQNPFPHWETLALTSLAQTIMVLFVFPHIFVWGSCFWFCIPGSSSAFSSSALLHTLSTHTLSTNTLSKTLCPHTLCPHTLCHHTLYQQTLCPKHFVHTHFVHTHFVTTHFVHKHFVHKHFVHTRFINIHSLSTHTLSPHTLSTNTLSTNTLSTHALSTYTLSPQPHTQHTCTHTHTHQQTQHTTTHTHTHAHTHNNTTHTHTRAKDTWWHSHTHTTTTHTHTHTHTQHTHTHKNTLGDIRGRRGTWWHPPLFHVAGVAQNSHPPSFCVAGVALMVLCGALGALTHIYRRFAWQAWHSWHWVAPLGRDLAPGRRATLRGRRGTIWHPPSFHVAGVAQTHIHRRFAWQACHLWYWVAPLGRDLAPGRRATLRGRRGTTWHPPSFHVAGVAQTHIYCRFAWQACHLWYWVAPLGRDLAPGRRATLRGRRGTTWHPPSFHVAGVAQTHIYCPNRHFAWQAWHNLTSTFVSRGRRGTNSHLPSFHVVGVALMALGGALGLAWAPVTPRHFAWQAWHNLTSTFVSRGRRGTNSHLPSFHVAGVALMALGGALGLAWAPVTPRHFAWQAWHKLTSTVGLRGRRGTNSHLLSFCVAGVALMVLGGALGPGFGAGAPRHFAWQAWHKLTSTFGLRGRRGTNSHLPSFCVAGVALMALGGALGPGFGAGAPRHFAWQAWHNLTSTFVSRGRRGTNSHPPSFCVAGVPLMVLGGALGPGFGAGAPRHFAWQAWHNLTSTFVSRGRRGTNSHLPSFCVAGVPLMVLGGALGPGFGAGAPRHFAWQAWHNLTSTFVSRGRRGTNSHLLSQHWTNSKIWKLPKQAKQICKHGVTSNLQTFAAAPERVQNITLVSRSQLSTPSLW